MRGCVGKTAPGLGVAPGTASSPRNTKAWEKYAKTIQEKPANSLSAQTEQVFSV